MKRRFAINKILDFLLTDPDIIVIHGARQVGKTSLLHLIMDYLRQQQVENGQIYYLDLENLDFLKLCNSGPENVLAYLAAKGVRQDIKCYLFIDEIQYLDNPSNFLKLMHDHYQNQIKLICSGSSSFEIKSKFKDSLVGRTVNFELFPLDFAEYLTFKDKTINLTVNLPEIIQQELKEDFLDFVRYGGYPRIVLEPNVAKKEVFLKQILATYVKKDLVDLVRINNLQKYNHLLQVLAEQTTKLLNESDLANTLNIVRPTINHYLFMMENTYVIRQLQPFYQNIRSELSKMPKIFWEDTGLMSLLRYNHFSEKIEGEAFENAIYTELRKKDYIEQLNYWRTTGKQEIDFIVTINKKQIPLEVKLTYSGQSVSSMNYFLENYQLNRGAIITLNKNGLPRTTKQIDLLYPWEIDTYLQQAL